MKQSFKAILRTDLGKKESSREYRIDLRIYVQGKQYKISTNQYCKEMLWNKSKGYPIKDVEDETDQKRLLALKKFISDKKNDFVNYCMEKEFNKEPIKIEEIKLLLKENDPSLERSNKKRSIEKAFDLYINTLKANNKRANSIKNIESSKRVLSSFARKKYGREVLASEIDRAFVFNFKSYLLKNLGNKESSANKRLRNLRSVILEAIRHEWQIKNPFTQRIITQDIPNNIALTKEEYEQFKKVVLPANAPKGMKLAKDLFIFSCETGLRISDVKNFKYSNVKVDRKTRKEYIELIQIKNNNNLTIGLTNQAKAIIIKYKKNSNKNQHFGNFCDCLINQYIKKIASMAGIQKHITFHTARHTYATLSARCGKNEIEIAILLGDKDSRMAKTYVNLNKNDKLSIFEDYMEKRKTL